jgi:aryl carrier-like protein
MPAEHAELLATLERCHTELTGRAVDLAAVPADCAFIDLVAYGLDLDSIELLELVVLLEEALGCDLDLAEVEEDWSTYRWGQFLTDLAAAAGQ